MQRESEQLGGGLSADRPQVSSAPLQAGALPCAARPLSDLGTVQSFQSCAVRGRRPTTLATFELWVAGVGAVSATVLLVRRRALAR